MATIKFNNGKPAEIRLSNPLAKVFVSASIKVGVPSVKIAGHSILNLDGEVSIEDVQFIEHELGTGNQINSRQLVVMIDVSKFKVEKKELKDADLAVTCHLRFKTKKDEMEECVLNDKSSPESNTLFVYVLKFIK